MNYQSLQDEIKQITDLANSVPDPFKEKCFEVLLQHLLSQQIPLQSGVQGIQQQPVDSKPPSSDKLPFPSAIKVFMRKTGVTEDELNAILLYENNDVLFIHEPKTTIIGQGQIEWTLLLALKKAILTNEFSVDPEDVRSICKEKGFYDASNFAAVFKFPSNKVLFKGLLKPQGESQSLTDVGQTTLCQLVKTYAGRNNEAGNLSQVGRIQK